MKTETLLNFTFNKEELSRIKRAKSLLEKVIYDSCSNNRDTQMLEEAIKEIKKVINYQYENRNYN